MCAAFALISVQLEVAALDRSIDTLSESIELQRLKNAELEILLSIEETDEYIERVARDELGFCYPDERIIIDRSGG